MDQAWKCGRHHICLHSIGQNFGHMATTDSKGGWKMFSYPRGQEEEEMDLMNTS